MKKAIGILRNAILATLLVTILVLAGMSIGFIGYYGIAGEHEAATSNYNPWADLNCDDFVDIFDIVEVALAFGSEGTSFMEMAGIEYDSGWLNITDQNGQYYTLVHDKNLTSLDLMVEARGFAPGWNKTYGGASNDGAFAGIQASDGGYALAGGTRSYSAGEVDFWLVKTDSAGNIQWSQAYGGDYYDQAMSVIQTTDGGYALAGYTMSFGEGYFDFWLIKTDADGKMEWNRTYGGMDDDEAYSVVQTNDGGYALGGFTWSFGSGGYDAWLVKTDEYGNMQWNRTYGGPLDDYAYSVARTLDGGYALAGEASSFGVGYSDFWLIKTDASGIAQWSKTYRGSQYDSAYCVIQTSDYGYALAGQTLSFGAGSGDFWLVKTDSAGNEQWNKTYGGSEIDYANSIVQAIDGGYALAGDTWSFGAGGLDAWLVKTDAYGNMQWNRTYGGINDDEAFSVIQTNDNAYALAGDTYSFGAGFRDVWLVKTDAISGLAWKNLTPNSIAVCRETVDGYWNFLRVRLSKPRSSP